MKAYAIIGAGFGDEGKGASVDALVHHLLGRGRRPVVVRAGSGAQAAHTVEASGARHVFGHVGSGALLGAPTWFGPRFVHNPPLFLRERDALRAMGYAPFCSADPAGAVTLPVDMAVNQALERARGADRHGSCGIGFGEAVGRSERAADRITVADLHEADRATLLARVVAVSRACAERRIAETGLDGEGAAFVRRAARPALLDAWLADALRFAALVPPRHADTLREDHDTVVFEGAQGLLLDRDAAFFPHVTRSRTGLANVTELVPLIGVTALEAIHVTRAYATRHGAGPLPGKGLPGPDGAPLVFADPTNGPNAFQGRLRFAPLVPSLLGGAVLHDLATSRSALGAVSLRSRLAVTCLDQTEGRALVLRDGRMEAIDVDALPAALGLAPDEPPWLAHGPARDDRPWPAPALERAA